MFQRGDGLASKGKVAAWEAIHGAGEVRVQGWAIDSSRSRVIGTDPIESLNSPEEVHSLAGDYGPAFPLPVDG